VELLPWLIIGKKSKIIPKKSMMIFHQSEPEHTTTPCRKEGRKDGRMDEMFYVERKYCLVMGVSYVLTIWHAPSYLRKALPGFPL